MASNHQSDAGYVTVSIGVALATAADSTAETAVRLADEAMYQAKRAGRNRVHVKA
ncbi:MAG: diguanylate cyclase [Rheinheimera sp.]|nr:diguanylate cyclase [Rheinheimera sp.]